MTSAFLGLINLLEELTEFRETFDLLDYCLIIKGYNSGIADGRGCTRQGVWGRGMELHTLGASLSPNLRVFTKPEAVQTLFGGVFWRIHHVSTID